MIIGVPKEIKTAEFRVGLIPSGAKALTRDGHQVLIQAGAGISSGYPDQEYKEAGAEVIKSANEVWEKAEIIVKVKEPQKPEYDRMRKNQVLFCFFHLAPLPDLTRVLIDKGVNAVAFETIQTKEGLLPCLMPMSEIAGRMSVQVGASYLMRDRGGPGILLGGVPGVAPCEVLVLGAGTSGTNAARLAVGMGARVRIMDTNLSRLAYLDDIFNGKVTTVMSDDYNIERYVPETDLLVGAVLLPGSLAPRLVSEDLVKKMRPGSVIVDISVDQGGCIATTHPTTHKNPVYIKHGVTHYCVANMPGAVPRTSTQALANATFPYLLKIARQGLEKAAGADTALLRGINVYTAPGSTKGLITNQGVADAFGCKYVSFETVCRFPENSDKTGKRKN